MRTNRALSYTSVLLFSLALIIAPHAIAETTAQFKLQIECKGPSNGQIAIRWGSPHYGDNQYMPLFETACNQSPKTTLVSVTNPNSQFEVQTQGGIETAYEMSATLVSPSNQAGQSIQIDHDVTADATTHGSGFTLTRSSGPNKYGEQNFRVALSSPGIIPVRVTAQATGNNSAQVALRWGHPDFEDNGYIGVWKTKPGPAQTRTFSLNAQKSEFEIQTEGGTGTSYSILIWLGIPGQDSTMPSIVINHQVQGGTVVETSFNNVQFNPSKGNIYGEMDVGVTIPWITAPVAPPQPKAGWAVVSMMMRTMAGSGPVPYAGTLGLGAAGQGHFTQIQNDENYPIELELVGMGGSTSDCGKNNGKTGILQAHALTAADVFTKLFGSSPQYPASFAGCAGMNPPPQAFQFSAYTVAN